MDAALCWLIEAGEVPADRFWVNVELPAPSAGEIDLTGTLESKP